MAQAARQESPQPAGLAGVLSRFNSGLSAAEIERRNRQTQSMQTMEFFWHCVGDINNRRTNKNYGSMIYSVLPRMELIPIYTWPVPVIRARNAHFSLGRITMHGSLAPTGVEVSQRSCLAHETITLLQKAYGVWGARVLDALTTDEDEGKVEAFLLYDAVMRTGFAAAAPGDKALRLRGVDLIIEDLSDFLTDQAPALLQKALEDGVQFVGGEFCRDFPQARYALGDTAEDKARLKAKGEGMIAGMLANVELTERWAKDEETGVLTVTRGQLLQAKAGVKDSKSRLDRRDEFLMRQFPSFSMDTDVERAQRASAGVVQSMNENAAVGQNVMLGILEELKALRVENNKTAMELAALKAGGARQRGQQQREAADGPNQPLPAG